MITSSNFNSDIQNVMSINKECQNNSLSLKEIFHKSIINNELEIFEKCIRTHKLDVNMIFDDGYTPLIIACKKGNFLFTELLLKNGANTEIFDQIDISPLIHSSNNIIIFSLLLRYGAKIDAFDNIESKNTIFHFISINNKAEILALLLLKNNIDVNIINQINNLGYTCLMYATLHNNYCIIMMLLSNYENIDINANINDKDALILCVENDCYESLRVLLYYKKITILFLNYIKINKTMIIREKKNIYDLIKYSKIFESEDYKYLSKKNNNKNNKKNNNNKIKKNKKRKLNNINYINIQ